MDIRSLIVNLLLKRPSSLADLADQTGASLPTIRRAVGELERDRWLTATGRVEATGGRPAKLYSLELRFHTLVGVHMAHPGMRLVATDLLGNVVAADAPASLIDLDPETSHAAILRFIENLNSSQPLRSVTGIGVATPGYVDQQSGTVITIGRVPHWNNLPLKARLEEATGVGVAVVNDFDALAAREFEIAEGGRNRAYVGFGEGLKFSIFIEEASYSGPFGNAGLVGRAALAERYGGSVARLFTVSGFVAAYAEASGEDPPSYVNHPDDVHQHFTTALELAAASEQPASEIVSAFVDALGSEIAALVHLVQPSLIVVGGALAGAPVTVIDAIESATRKRLPTLIDNSLIFRRARARSENDTAIGAATVYLRAALPSLFDRTSRHGVRSRSLSRSPRQTRRRPAHLSDDHREEHDGATDPAEGTETFS